MKPLLRLLTAASLLLIAPKPCSAETPNLIAAYSRADAGAAACDGFGPTGYLELPSFGPLGNARPLERDVWARGVVAQARVYRSARTRRPTADVVVFVHGYAMDRHRLSVRVRGLRQDLAAAGFAGAVTAFDWPSPDRGVPLTYVRDFHVARRSGRRLVTDCLDPLRRAAPAGVDLRLHVIAHSLGAMYVQAAFADLSACPGGPRLENLILLAGDIACSSLGQLSCCSLAEAAAQAHRVTSYGSVCDTLLQISTAVRLGAELRLGLGGLDPALAAAGAVAVDGALRYSTLCPAALTARFEARMAAEDLRVHGTLCRRPPPLPVRLVTRAAGGSGGPVRYFPSHEWYFEDPLVIRDLRLLLQHDETPPGPPTRCLDPEGGVMLTPE